MPPAALTPWERAQGCHRGDSDKQLHWHISHTVRCNSFIKTRWNRLLKNSSYSCLSRNNTQQAFVSNPLWSVCEGPETGSYDSHMLCPLRVFNHCQTPDQSQTLSLNMSQKYQRAPNRVSEIIHLTEHSSSALLSFFFFISKNFKLILFNLCV